MTLKEEIQNFQHEWLSVVSFSGLLLWAFAGILLMLGDSGLADIFALSGYWLLFVAIAGLAIKHFLQST